MKQLLRWLVLLAFVVGMMMAFVPFLIPDVARVFDPLICPKPDESVTITQGSFSGGGIRMAFQCVNADGVGVDAWIVPYVVFFSAWCWLPLLPIILLTIITRRKPEAQQSSDLPTSL